jgi:transposase-like protein
MEKVIIKERRHYPIGLKEVVVKEYLAGGITYRAIMRKYDIKTAGCITRWMEELGYAKTPLKDGYLLSAKPLSLPVKKPNKEVPLNALSQEQRIKELERLLEDEQLRSEMYKRMIEIAERDLNIPIQKKSDTK